MDIYDRRRIDFFKLIDEFEGKILSRYQADFPTKAYDGTYSYKDFMAQRGLDVKSKDNIKDYFPHNLFMLIATDHLEDKEDISKYNEDIVQLRNKFLHNEFPFAFIKDGQERLSWLKEEVDKNTKPYITDRIFDIAETYYKAAIISTKKKAEKPLKIEELV